ncbi:MAG: hypothetical protein M0R06_00140 [Sphaerochaeta sp.]|jgi:hypothetical protein|nr:hypothetical protein [Sphaerochaeta sp.]
MAMMSSSGLRTRNPDYYGRAMNARARGSALATRLQAGAKRTVKSKQSTEAQVANALLLGSSGYKLGKEIYKGIKGAGTAGEAAAEGALSGLGADTAIGAVETALGGNAAAAEIAGGGAGTAELGAQIANSADLAIGSTAETIGGAETAAAGAEALAGTEAATSIWETIWAFL